MQIQAVIFDLFHTLTGPEAEWSELPWTSDVLGIDRGVWNELLVSHSRWRLAGEETDAYTSVRTLARLIDSTVSEERIQARISDLAVLPYPAEQASSLDLPGL